MKLVRENLILEGMAEREPALRAKYSKIPHYVFLDICNIGYTYPQLVPYIYWLLNIYDKGKLKVEDIYKAVDYLLLFSKQAVKNKLERRDINQYEDLVDLYGAIEPYKESEEILSDNEIKQKSLVKVFKNYSLHIPRSYEDSCRLGAGTEWCTATGKTRKYYDDYTSGNSKLFIFISRKDSKEKFQLEFLSHQFMNRNDKALHFFNWLEEDISLCGEDLTTLVGLNIPKKIRGDFKCSYNKLTTLEGAPQIVMGNFDCYGNSLTTLAGAPTYVGLDFYCHRNKLSKKEIEQYRKTGAVKGIIFD